jgi:hypothetical protein
MRADSTMRKLFLLTVLIWVATSLHAQAPLLERKISVSLNQETVEASLRKISNAAGFVFSYNPDILDKEKTLTYTFVNKPVREILDEIFKGSIQYKVRGQYIILTSSPQSTAKKEPAIVAGYIVDEATGERLRDVSVYDPVTLTSTITDSYGYFEIKIDKPAPEIILSVNRKNYTDTLVAVQSRNRLLNIPMRINKEKFSVIADSVSQKLKRFWEKKEHLFDNPNLVNIDDTLYRTSQVSLVPFLGTNHKMSGNVINDYSFNIIGGYSLGVTKLEIGGLFNLVRGNTSGAQFAGLFNGVGGQMKGVQFAGVFNGNHSSARGAQFAGVLNLNLKDADGLMMAGVGNITTGDLNAPQFAGVFNIASQNGGPLQLAGVYNISAGDSKGFQGAGVFNIAAKRFKGTQLAGVMNISGKEIKGAQIAGVLNVASKVNGIQLGLINMADSVKGIPIGFMSLVWKGYHKIEVSADEIFYNNLSFRTGVRQFYNIFTAGAKPSTYQENETVWTFGYGVGTAPRLSRKMFLNFDLTSNQIVQGNSIEAINLLNKLYVGFDYQAFTKMSLTFGATVNGLITKNSIDGYPPLFTDYQPEIFYDRDFGSDHNLKMWVGAKVGLRFL